MGFRLEPPSTIQPTGSPIYSHSYLNLLTGIHGMEIGVKYFRAHEMTGVLELICGTTQQQRRSPPESANPFQEPAHPSEWNQTPLRNNEQTPGEEQGLTKTEPLDKNISDSQQKSPFETANNSRGASDTVLLVQLSLTRESNTLGDTTTQLQRGPTYLEVATMGHLLEPISATQPLNPPMGPQGYLAKIKELNSGEIEPAETATPAEAASESDATAEVDQEEDRSDLRTRLECLRNASCPGCRFCPTQGGNPTRHPYWRGSTMGRGEVGAKSILNRV